jgi:ubiquinone biosynthesis protein
MAELTQKGRDRSLLRVAVDDISRFAAIAQVMARFGFSRFAVRSGIMNRDDVADEAPPAASSPDDAARRFREMLEELGPTFVKVGQILSTRPDVLPPPFIRELSRLQDDAPPVAFEAISEAVRRGLGEPIEQLFSEFDEAPLASASMAQTHLARLPDGTRVIVKVQRPEIAETMRADLDLLHLFARLLEATIADMEYYAPGDIVRVLDDALSHELDFLHEAGNIELFHDAFREEDRVVVPRLHPDLSCRTVLTMEYIQGRKISDLEPGSDEAEQYALALIEAFFRMIFENGNFHADPHPGNLIVADDGRLALIDFGLCGYLSSAQRDRLVSLVVAVLTGDVDGIARVLVRMGRPLGHINMGAFKAEIASIRERYLKRNLRNLDLSAFLDECIDAAQRYRIRVATDYSLLSKATVTLEGVVRSIAPDLDLLAHVGPYQRRLLEQQYSADRLTKSLVTGALHLGNFLREVPDQLEQVLMDLESGRLQVRVADDGARAIAGEMNRQTTRLIMAVCAGALIIATPLFLANEPWWLWGKVPVATTLCALSSANFAFWGLTWHVVGGKERDWRIRLGPLLRFLRRH